MTKGVIYILIIINTELRTLLLLTFSEKLVLSQLFCKTLTKLNKRDKTKRRNKKIIRTRDNRIVRE